MTTPAIGTCKLCLSTAELRFSHIVPAWAHKRARGEDSPPILIEAGKAFLSSKQVAEYMLCDSCEQRFSDVERPISRLPYLHHDARTAEFLDLVGPIRAIANGFRLALPGRLDVNALVYFGASVLWRASIAKSVPNCQLGTKYNEEFRKYLLGEAEFPSMAVCVVCFVEAPSDGEPHIATACSTPVTEKIEGHHIHRFTIFGLWYYIVVGNRVPDWICEFCAVRSAEHHVLLAPQGALLGWFGAFAARARPVGTLAKAPKAPARRAP